MACCVVLGVAAIASGQLRDESRALAAFTIAAGVSFIVAGLAASARRPEKATGILMVGSGFVLFAGALIQANHSLPFTIGLAVILIPTAVLAAPRAGLPGRAPALDDGSASSSPAPTSTRS